MCTVLRFDGLSMETFAALRQTNKSWCTLCDAWILASQVEPKLVMSVRKGQLAIPNERVANLG